MRVLLCLLVSVLLVGSLCDFQCSNIVEQYDVVWNTVSKDSRGSMPIGNGDVALNVWVQTDGLYFYIGKSDAWSDNSRILKVGGVKVELDPNPFTSTNFQQAVRIGKGIMEVSTEDIFGTIWVDIHSPIISVNFTSHDNEYNIRVTPIIWRKTARALQGSEQNSARGLCFDKFIETADYSTTFQNDRGDTVATWYHRNDLNGSPNPTAWESSLKRQGLWEYRSQFGPDPLFNRTFGAAVWGQDLVWQDNSLQSTDPSSSVGFTVAIHTNITIVAQEWVTQLRRLVNDNLGNLMHKKLATEKWWNSFWEQSCIVAKDSSGIAKNLSMIYNLQRWMEITGGGRGKSAIHFNGLLYTTDYFENDVKVYDADYRLWGGAYWAQNTRFPYWAMLASGDFESLFSLFDMYMKMIPLAQERTKIYFGHDGAYFAETFWFWGTLIDLDYGCNRGPPVWAIDNQYIRRHYTGGIETLAIMIDYYQYTGNDTFVKDYLIPYAEQIATFYSYHYQMTLGGKLVFAPAQSLETWQDAINPITDIAGLNYTMTRILAEVSNIPPTTYQLFKVLLNVLPPIPLSSDGTILKPAQSITESRNIENTELYATFPFRIYGVGAPDLEIGTNTFAQRPFPCDRGWCQDDIHAALLGLSDAAKKTLTDKLTKPLPQGYRFPTFAGQFYDYTPELDHFSTTRISTQYMIMQPRGKQLLMFTSWPQGWDVEFKLFAPYNTVVQGRCVNNKLVSFTVTPSERTVDVVHSTTVCVW